MKLTLAIVLALFIVGCPHSSDCPPHSVVCPNDDIITDGSADDANEEPEGASLTPAGKVCSNLRKLGCQEGFVRKNEVGETRNCTVAVQKSIDDHLTKVPVDCLIAARSKADVHHCGSFVPCP